MRPSRDALPLRAARFDFHRTYAAPEVERLLVARAGMSRPAIAHLVPAPTLHGSAPEDILESHDVEIDLGSIEDTHLRGRLRLVSVPGHGHEPVSSPRDIASAEAACVAWGRRIGLADGVRDYLVKFEKTKLAALAAYTLPDVPVARAGWFMELQAFIFTIDDALDNLEDIRTEGHIPYGRLAGILDLLAAALAGEPANPAEERRAAAELPLFDAFLRAMRDVREGALGEGLDVGPFVASMRDYFDALAWEHGARAEAAYAPSLSTYMENRHQTISYLQSIESFLLLKGISLPASTRERHPIKLLLANACRHVILVNDVFSLVKEMKLGELENVLLLDGDTSALPKKLAALLRDINALAEDTAAIAARIDDHFADDGAVFELVETVVNSLNGHIAWYCASHRYGRFLFAAGAG